MRLKYTSPTHTHTHTYNFYIATPSQRAIAQLLAAAKRHCGPRRSHDGDRTRVWVLWRLLDATRHSPTFRAHLFADGARWETVRRACSDPLVELAGRLEAAANRPAGELSVF